MALLEITKSNLQDIQNKFSAAQDFKKSTYKERVNLWEKGEHARLYVPRNAYEQAGYIDLHTGEVHATRDGNVNTLEEVRDYIAALEAPEPEEATEPETQPETETANASEAKITNAGNAEAIRAHVEWLHENRGNWWENRYTTMLTRKLMKDELAQTDLKQYNPLTQKDELIAAIDAELRNAGLSEYCSK